MVEGDGVCQVFFSRTLGNLLVKALKLVCVEANSVPHLCGRGTWGSKVSVWLVRWAIMELRGVVPEDSSGDVRASDKHLCTTCPGGCQSSDHLEMRQALTLRSKPSSQREYTVYRLASDGKECCWEVMDEAVAQC